MMQKTQLEEQFEPAKPFFCKKEKTLGVYKSLSFLDLARFTILHL